MILRRHWQHAVRHEILIEKVSEKMTILDLKKSVFGNYFGLRIERSQNSFSVGFQSANWHFCGIPFLWERELGLEL